MDDDDVLLRARDIKQPSPGQLSYIEKSFPTARIVITVFPIANHPPTTGPYCGEEEDGDAVGPVSPDDRFANLHGELIKHRKAMKMFEEQYQDTSKLNGVFKLRAIRDNLKIIENGKLAVLAKEGVIFELSRMLKKEHGLALRYAMKEHEYTQYRAFMETNTNNAGVSGVMLIVQTTIKSLTDNQLFFEKNLGKLSWEGRKREMESERKYEEMMQALMKRQVVCVLLERIIKLAGDEKLPTPGVNHWRYYRRRPWAEIVGEFEAFKNGVNLQGAWMTEDLANTLTWTLQHLFPEEKLNTRDLVFAFMEKMQMEAKSARDSGFVFAHVDDATDAEVEKCIKGTPYEFWLTGLKKTKQIDPVFKNMRLLGFLY